MTTVDAEIEVEIQDTSSVWHAIDGAETDLTFSRGNVPNGLTDDLTPGNIALGVAGAAWSPSGNANMRPRRPIRVRAMGVTGDPTIWYGLTTMPTLRIDKQGRHLTRISGYDSMGAAALAKHNTGQLVQGTFATQMAAASVAKTGFRTYGTSFTPNAAPTRTFAAVTVSGKPTVLEMLTRVRNSFIAAPEKSQCWAHRQGFTLIGRGPASVNSTIWAEFSDDPAITGSNVIYYTDAEIGHNAELFKNGITFNWADGTTSGVYVDTSSTTDWDRNDTEMVGILSGATYNGVGNATLAETYFETQDPSGVRLRSVTFNVLENSWVLLSDPVYQRVTVHYDGADHDYWICRESHDVKPDRWFVTYDLRPIDTRAISAPTLV